MQKKYSSFFWFYGLLFLILVGAGMALSGFKKQGSTAYAVGMCTPYHYSHSDIRMIQRDASLYLSEKTMLDKTYRRLQYAARRYDKGAYPYALSSQIKAYRDAVYALRVDYLRKIGAMFGKFESRCSLSKLDIEIAHLPRLETQVFMSEGTLVTKERIARIPLMTPYTYIKFDGRVANIYAAAHSYNSDSKI